MAKAAASARTATNSRVRLTLAAAMMLATTGPVLAQTEMPPPPTTADTAPATITSPVPAAASAPPSADAPPPAPDAAAPVSQPPPVDAGSVAVQPLAALDLFSAGRQTGLGNDLWKGSSADIARTVIPTLDTAPLSPAAAALARAVLATAATAPDGAGDDAALAGARVKALLDLGDAEGAALILDHTPGLSSSASLSQAAAEIDLITDQPDKACAVADTLSVNRDDIYWLRLRAFCQARAGKTDMAQLTLTLANQQAPDPIFGRLMGALLAGGDNPGAPSLRNGLDYALSTQLKLDLTPALPRAAAPIARHLAALAPPPPPTSAPAAPGLSTMSPPGTAQPAADAPAANPSASPTPVSTPTPVLISEADVLAMLRSPTNFPDYVAAAKAAQPAIAGLVQAKTPLTSPIALANAAIVAGDLIDGDAIRAGLAPDAVPGASPVDLAILDAGLAAAHGKPDDAVLSRLVAYAGQGDDKQRQRAQDAAAMTLASGAGMAPADRAAFSGFTLAADDAPVAKLLTLDLAADSGLKGETALLALSIAEGGVSGPRAADRAHIIRALVRVGLGAYAQGYVVEGLAELQTR